jgi:hypothetical protein
MGQISNENGDSAEGGEPLESEQRMQRLVTA